VKNSFILFVIILVGLPFTGFAQSTGKKIETPAVNSNGFPLEIMGQSLSISTITKRADILPDLKKIIKSAPSLSTPERIQYDFQAAGDKEAPMTLLIDFNKGGTISNIGLNANEEGQNPVAKKLLGWLGQYAGKPTVSTKMGKVWKFREWEFSFKNGGSGEDSEYGFSISPLKSSKK
jgi:hypothetical protein